MAGAATLVVEVDPARLRRRIDTRYLDRMTESLDEDGAEEPTAPAPVVALAISRLDLERAIDMLPDGARAAFLLHDVEGFEHREIAQILGISEGTSKSQVHKARKKLRAILRQ